MLAAMFGRGSWLAWPVAAAVVAGSALPASAGPLVRRYYATVRVAPGTVIVHSSAPLPVLPPASVKAESSTHVESSYGGYRVKVNVSAKGVGPFVPPFVPPFAPPFLPPFGPYSGQVKVTTSVGSPAGEPAAKPAEKARPGDASQGELSPPEVIVPPRPDKPADAEDIPVPSPEAVPLPDAATFHQPSPARSVLKASSSVRVSASAKGF